MELILRLPRVTVLWKGTFGPASPSEDEFAAEVPFGSLSELCFDIFIFGSFTIGDWLLVFEAGTGPSCHMAVTVGTLGRSVWLSLG